MTFEIVLKPGETTVLVSRITNLIADAMHPLPPEGRTEDYVNMLTETQREHRSALMANIRYGSLTVLSPKTNRPTDENNPLAFIPLEVFIQYVAQFNIRVRFAADAGTATGP